MIKVIFFGTSSYCLPVLSSLKKNFNLIAVVTKSRQNAVYEFSGKNNIKTYSPQNTVELLGLKSELKNFNPDLFIVADYGFIIPKEIFNLPKHKTINIHFSKLPLYRGPSPVQYSIINNDSNSWVSIIVMDENIDTGDLIWQKEYGENPQYETTTSLYIKLFKQVSKDIPSIIKEYAHGKLIPESQTKKGVSYSKRIGRNDGYIPFDRLKEAVSSSKHALDIERKIRAFTPWPGVWTTITSNKRLKILNAHLDKENLVIDKVQLEGKNPVSWTQFLEGYPQIKNQLNLSETSSSEAKSSL